MTKIYGKTFNNDFQSMSKLNRKKFYDIQKCNFGPGFVPSATVLILVPLNDNYDM